MTIDRADTTKHTRNERIEVIHNKDIIVNMYLQALHNANKWDYFVETKSSLLVPLGMGSLNEALIDAKNRGIRQRFITEITESNVSRCKDTMKIVELKHLEGVRGNFAVSDTEYIAITVTGIGAHSITTPYAIYSNVNGDIKQQNYVFEILWNRAVPAERRISEIEEGAFKERTEVLYGTDNVMNNELHFFSEAKTRIDTCMDYTRPALAIGAEAIRKSFVEAKRKGVQLRYLTEITNDNLSYCKEIMSMVDEVRHLDGIKGNFMISESEYLAPITSRDKIKPADIDESNRKLAKILVDAGIQIKHVRNLPPSFTFSGKQIAVTIEKMEASGAVQNLLLSNEPAYIGHFLSIFEELWKNGINAVDRLKDIEAGAYLADMEVIQSSSRAGELYLELVKNANSIEKKDVGGGQEVARVSIKDNCTGIDPDILPRLFEKFASKSFEGIGLGLFICRSIVEAHDGKKWAENNNDDGATFHFTLPILHCK